MQPVDFFAGVLIGALALFLIQQFIKSRKR